MINKKFLLLLVVNLISLSVISQKIIKINRDPDNRKDYANVFFKTQYTLFDYWSDEPIFPDENEIYHIYYATNENKTPKEFIGTAYQLSTYIAYKFSNFENCKNWCEGAIYKRKVIKKYEPELVGCVNGDCVNGYGVKRFSIGTFSGYFKDGYISNGELKYDSGDIYKGNFLLGTKNGFGILKFNSGSIYEGEWVNDVMQGYGTLVMKDGSSYKGDWVNGKKQGKGVTKWASGSIYNGDWVNDVKQGQGKLTYSSGVIEEGTWVNDKFVSSYTSNYSVASSNNSNSSSNNYNNASSTNPMENIQNGFKELVNNPLIKGMLANEVKLSNSGMNVNGEKCKKCKIVLKTPKNRACYICNRQFSGWGFIKETYGITKEHEELLSSCFPELGCHNYRCWRIHEDACCSRQCAMKL
ncbi:MAG: MORN repeat-containing protein [Flavobacterium sp.]|uniref:MORN repeat-containing protein n=1 Tax=Flavobacterium sp. TaxID=239 RepID=UPI003BC8F20D